MMSWSWSENKKYGIKNQKMGSDTDFKDLIDHESGEHSTDIFFGGIRQGWESDDSENEPHFDGEGSKEHDWMMKVVEPIKGE